MDSMIARVELRALRGVKDHASEIPGGDADGGEAGLLHERGEFGRRRELGDGAGEIPVRLGVAGNGAADARQNVLEVEAEQSRHRTGGRLGEFENADFPALFEDTRDLAEAVLVVREIAKAEGGGDEVEARIGKRKMEGVGSSENDGAISVLRFFSCAGEHRFNEVAAHDRTRIRTGLRG